MEMEIVIDGDGGREDGSNRSYSGRGDEKQERDEEYQLKNSIQVAKRESEEVARQSKDLDSPGAS